MWMKYLLAILFFSACFCDKKPHVKTPLGEVAGNIRTSDGGRKFSAFEGIPFAKPPIGERRFEEPEPIEPWIGVWNASFLTQCAQIVLFQMPQMPEGVPKQVVDEDCLHINVYVPREEPNPNEKLDVIVHIHGGAYMYGSGHSYTHPRYLMDHEIIFVTFNYRLGILGFLSTEDDVVPGNNGLKDQVLALKWIQENIASFGGNPDSVTITGLSAGSSSVHLHYLSELSKGLFHRGLSNSATAGNFFNVQKEPLNKAKMLAQAVGCPIDSSSILINCLKQRPYHHILAQLPLFFGYGNAVPAAPFAPSVEKGTKSKAFLSDYPYRLLEQGKVYDVPWIASNTAQDGYLSFIYSDENIDEINSKWEELAPYLLDYNYTLPKSQWKEVARKVKDFYLGENQNLNFNENIFKTISIFSDRFFLTDGEEAVLLHSKAVKSPVYYYLFNYPGDNNERKIVAHAGDAKYFFGDTFFNQPLTSNELLMKDMMVEMLINYAKTGEPTIRGVDWQPTQSDVLTYLNVTSIERENNKLETTEELTPRAFWKSLGFQENANLPSIKGTI